MGDKPAESESSLKLWWQECPEKYRFEDGYKVEEVKTPWDLYVEGAYLHNSFGNHFHRVLVEGGIHRIFSVRTPDGFPCCDIITKPVDGRILSVAWSMRRAMKTSSSFKVDGQDLILLDVVGNQDRRVEDVLLSRAQEFFTKKGGKLKGEHPNSLAISSSRDVKVWREIVETNKLLDLFISEELVWPADISWKTALHAINLSEALILLRVRYWQEVYLNGDEEWAPKVVDHIQSFSADRPVGKMNIIGNSEQAKRLNDQVNTLQAVKVS